MPLPVTVTSTDASPELEKASLRSRVHQPTPEEVDGAEQAALRCVDPATTACRVGFQEIGSHSETSLRQASSHTW
jgi:hypothetical protein